MYYAQNRRSPHQSGTKSFPTAQTRGDDSYSLSVLVEGVRRDDEHRCHPGDRYVVDAAVELAPEAVLGFRLGDRRWLSRVPPAWPYSGESGPKCARIPLRNRTTRACNSRAFSSRLLRAPDNSGPLQDCGHCGSGIRQSVRRGREMFTKSVQRIRPGRHLLKS